MKGALTKRRQRLAGVRGGRGSLLLVTLSAENSFLCLPSRPSLYLMPFMPCLCGNLLGCRNTRPHWNVSTAQRPEAIDGPSWPPPPPPALINTFICLLSLWLWLILLHSPLTYSSVFHKQHTVGFFFLLYSFIYWPHSEACGTSQPEIINML